MHACCSAQAESNTSEMNESTQKIKFNSQMDVRTAAQLHQNNQQLGSRNTQYDATRALCNGSSACDHSPMGRYFQAAN